MIRVIRKSETCVTLEGHAGSDIYGKDLVCAAVSALALTLDANIDRMRRQGMLESSVVHLAPGSARLRCTPRKERRKEVAAVFDGICAGFAMLGEKFPGLVRYSVVNAECKMNASVMSGFTKRDTYL